MSAGDLPPGHLHPCHQPKGVQRRVSAVCFYPGSPDHARHPPDLKARVKLSVFTTSATVFHCLTKALRHSWLAFTRLQQTSLCQENTWRPASRLNGVECVFDSLVLLVSFSVNCSYNSCCYFPSLANLPLLAL